MGVWKALKELDINISAIAGTSIGAINAAFMIQDSAEKLEQMYYDIYVDDVIGTSVEIGNNKNLFSISNIAKIARDFIRQKGFTNEPLESLLRQNLDIKKIYESNIDFGMVTYSIKDHKPYELFKNEIEKDNFIKYLLASACFPIYKAQKIGENTYLDGGLYDNMPINMLIRKGYKHFIAVDIIGPGLKRSLAGKEIYIKLIRPNESIGGIFDFDRDRIKRNVQLGYLDAMKAFCKLQGHRFYFKTGDFCKMLKSFSIQTIEGLEIAASLYGMNEYMVYKPDVFLKELKSKHDETFELYSQTKKALGLTTVIKEYDKIKNLLSKEHVLCFFVDKIADEPVFNIIGESALFSHYITAGKAIIELNHYLSQKI
ncbi:MAG: patatin-like phospholipase family protein [Clostridiaceae bacterium]|nr:patatin-like phospholipase family protein [Clostridiaceae bacterium]